MSTMDATALRLVDGYRANWSHRKTYRCAAGVAGHGTCSTVIRNSIAEKGLLRSIVPAARQFGTCAMSAFGPGPQDGGFQGAPGGPQGGPGMGGFGGGPQFGGGPRRRSHVQGVCCLGPFPIPFRF